MHSLLISAIWTVLNGTERTGEKSLLARVFTFSLMSLESNFIQSCFKCIHGQNVPSEILMQHYVGHFKSVFLKFQLNFLFCLDPTAHSCLFKNCTK